MVDKNKILWMSDGAQIVTGYSTISRKLMNYMADYGWNCHYLSHTGQHQTFMPGLKLEDGEEFKFTLHGSGMQPYCADIIAPKINELKPTIFGVLLDTFMLYPWILNYDFSPAKSLFYFPSDGRRFPDGCQQILQKFDYKVAMSMYARDQVKKDFNIDCDYIPHAVEPDIYKPLSEEEKSTLKSTFKVFSYSGECQGFLKDKFVIGIVARNQGRKMLDRALPVMQKIAEKIPNAVLLLHTDPYDPAAYFDFFKMIHFYGLDNRVVFTGTRYFKGFNYKSMNEVYNVMDVFFLPTSGEGFGIPTIEAMSAGIPVAVTDYTTTWELVTRNKSGESIKLCTEILGSWGVFRGVIDFQDAADKLIKLYNNPNLRKEYGLNGRQSVMREYNWQTVSKQWDDLFKKISKT